MGWACTKLWVWVNYDFIVLFKILRFRMSNIARNDIMKWRFQILKFVRVKRHFLRRCSVHIKRVAPIMSAGGWVLVYVPFNRLLVEFWVAKTMTFLKMPATKVESTLKCVHTAAAALFCRGLMVVTGLWWRHRKNLCNARRKINRLHSLHQVQSWVWLKLRYITTV